MYAQDDVTIKNSNTLYTNNIYDVDIMWLDTQGVELSALKSMGDKIKKVKFIE